ncbi:MAG: hypothetical protein D6805_09040, partial [Planctomycetota bacterium]
PPQPKHHTLPTITTLLLWLCGCFSSPPPQDHYTRITNSTQRALSLTNDPDQWELIAKSAIQEYKTLLPKVRSPKRKREIFIHILKLAHKYCRNPRIYLNQAAEFLRQFPKDKSLPLHLFEMAKFHHKLKEYDQALQLLEKIPPQFPHFSHLPQVYLWLAKLSYHRAQYQQARKYLAKYFRALPPSRHTQEAKRLASLCQYAILWKNRPIPSLIKKDLKNRYLDIHNLKNRVVLLIFWEGKNKNNLLPYSSLYQKYHMQGLEIVAVFLHKSRFEGMARDTLSKLISPKIQEWIHLWQREEEHPWHHPLWTLEDVWRPLQLRERFGLQNLPQTFLIDKQGKIYGINLSQTFLKQAIQKLLLQE